MGAEMHPCPSRFRVTEDCRMPVTAKQMVTEALLNGIHFRGPMLGWQRSRRSVVE